MKLPRPVSRLIECFERLPGIGPKTSQRLTFYLLNFPREEIQNFASALIGLKDGVKLCSVCKNVSEFDTCEICGDLSRNKKQIAVVSGPLDTFALEKAGFKGIYHVLHGVIDPLNNIGPEDLFIKDLLERVEELVQETSFDSLDNLLEIILATNTSMEGESTAMYLTKIIRNAGFDDSKVKITRIARGLPVGGDIEYADDITLTRALEGRREV